MTYRRTWFGYALWVVYTMLCAVFLFFAGSYAGASCLTDRPGNSDIPVSPVDSAIWISGLVAVVFAAAFYWIIRGISGQIRKKCAGRKRNWQILEGIAVFVFLALGIFLRIELAGDSIHLLNAAGSSISTYINGMDYFEMAVVTSGGSVEPAAYGCTYLYVACLSFVLSFLGNKAAVAIMFQVFLEIVGMVLAYGVTRKMAGGLPACVVLLYLACSPAYLEMIKNLGPESLFFVLYMIGMLAMVSLVKGYCVRQSGRIPVLAGAAGAGILVGILGYLDLSAVTILIVVTAAATGKKYRTEESGNAGRSGRMNAMVIVTVIAACAAGFMMAAAVFSVCRGTYFWQEIESWAALHVLNTRTFGFRPLYPYSLDMLFFGVLTVMASFLVFEFFRSGREQNYMLWILLCIAAAPTPLAVSGVQPFGVISMYIWGVLAGLGVQNCILGGRAGIVKTVIEETGQAVEQEAEIEGAAVTEADRAQEIFGMNGTENGNTEPAEIRQKNIETTQEAAGEQEAVERQKSAESHALTEAGKTPAPSKEPLPKKRYLDNPLPLPKKHVHKKMDYQYTVEEKDMKFDVEISEDDDFDI